MQEDYWAGKEAFNKVLKQEHARIALRTGRTSKDVWTGVSLSGGGIRSASFCLGGLQALAKYGVLSRIDYISTVSGGGYIGAGLQWLLCRDPDSDASKTKFPYGVGADLAVHPGSGQSNLQYLRWHANYLLPGKGLDIFSALTVVARTALLSVAIWFPLIVFVFYSLQWIASLPHVQTASTAILPINPLPFNFLCPGWRTVTPGCPLPTFSGEYLWPDQKGRFSIIYAIGFCFAYFAVVLLTALTVAVAFTSITKFPTRRTRRFVSVAIVSGIVGLSLLGYVGWLFLELMERLANVVNGVRGHVVVSDVLQVETLLPIGAIAMLPTINLAGMLLFGDQYKNADYFLRRSFEIFGGKLLRYTIYALVFATLPLTYAYAFRSTSIPAGSLSLVSGLITALVGHAGQSKQINFGRVGQIAIAAVACIFLYSLMLIAYHVSVLLFEPRSVDENYYLPLLSLGVVAASIIFGASSNLNTTGLHRFYRDRLMELFMPSAKSTKEGRSTYSFEADRLTVAGAWCKRTEKAVALFPIVNCNAILVNDRDPVLSRRGGASFTFTPLHVGGHEHGWERRSSYERKNREVTLATAIAASGAAANSNAGYAGTGITRNRAVSLVLSLLNIRLGVWVRRPSASPSINLLKPTVLFPSLWYGPFARGYRTRSTFVEVSDGGHFENLGVYELVRRRLDLIIAFDGEADPTAGLPALVSLSRRIEEDFGATLTFDTGVDALMPFTSPQAKYPIDAQFVDMPCIKATIRYADDAVQTTTLIYVKASLIKEAPFIAKGYRAQHPDYPNESTTNQFYSPEQFDAYRELGVACGTRATKLHLDAIVSALRKR
jgi:hypothetical protein